MPPRLAETAQRPKPAGATATFGAPSATAAQPPSKKIKKKSALDSDEEDDSFLRDSSQFAFK